MGDQAKRRARRRKSPERHYGFGTKAVHGGEGRKFPYDPSSTPIYQTSTFFFDEIEKAAEVEKGAREGFLYTRIGNPTVRAFEEKMALLEGGESAVAFASGIAAVAAVFQANLRPGDEAISSSRVYGGTRSFFRDILSRLDCRIKYFEPGEDLRKTIPRLVGRKTKLIFFETPSNPELSILDMRTIAGLARSHGVMSVIDNTFATPCLQRPIAFGIDCVIHSATKYIGGHGDSIGGVVIGSSAFVRKLRERILLNLGACLSPFNAWLFLRGLRSLHVRMERHCSSAAAVAAFLVNHQKVREVLYPGLKGHRDHEIAKAQMSGFGGMVSFRLRSRSACERFLRGLDLCRIGVSLGDTETIALNYALLFHPDKSDSACRRLGIEPTLIRLSCGLEDAEDIIADIEGALERA